MIAADNTGLHAFTPPAGDSSVDMLAQVFGPIVDGLKVASGQNAQAIGSDGNGQTIIGAMMGVFNNAVLFLAMLFVLYTTVRGTVDSAHSGELLGKKMSEIWVPLRTLSGTALILPLASGFSLLQMAVLWLALQGVGVASSMWDVAMNHLAANGTLGYVSMPDARPLAANILRSEICMAAMNKQYAETESKTRIEFVATSFPVAFGTAPDRNSQQYMTESYIDKGYAWRANDRTLNPNVCGSISFQDTPQSKDLSSSLRGPLLAAHSQAVRAMIDELRPVAAKIVAFQPPPAGAVDLAVTHYKTTLQSAANQAIAATPEAAKADFIAYARDAGWVAAGAWWSSLTRLNDAVQSAVNALPVSQASSIEELETKETLIAYKDAMMVTEQYLKDRAGAPRAEATADIKIRSADDVWRLLSVPAMAGIDTLTQRIAGANTSPVTQLRSIGSDVVSIGLALKSAMFVAAGFLGGKDVEWTVGLGFNVLEAFKTLSGTVEWLSSALFVIGAMLAYYLPAVPLIWWIMGVVRWLVSVAEAVLAAPVMAAFMVHPDSHDVVGKSGPGFMLIVAMILQPALLLFALILAILMTYPGAALVNQLFLQMVSGTVGSSGVGLVGLVAFTALYLTMMVLVMHSCFALVSAVPDNTMRYFAAQAGAYGVVKTGDEAYSNLRGGAAGAGAGMARGGVGLNSAQMKADSGGGRSENGLAGSSGRTENGFTNADHLPAGD
ncbi:MAG: DotA/TraY family protein [Propionivibrio sp.]